MNSSAAPTLTAFLDGTAFWAPKLPGWPAARSALRSESEPLAEPTRRPQPTLLAPTERRRAPDTVSIALEVALNACDAAELDPRTLASVFASTHGDLAIHDYICEALAADEPMMSPTRFHNSVHNAAAGYWTIGVGCMAPTTALTAYRETFAAALLEAMVQLECEQAPVLLVTYDIEAVGPLATVNESRGAFGAALALSPAATARSTHRLEIAVGQRETIDAIPPRFVDLFQGNPLASALPLFEALALEQPAARRLALSRGLALCIRVVPLA